MAPSRSTKSRKGTRTPAAKRPAARPALSGRRAALRRSEIPPAVLRDLNLGRLEAISLAEWLAIDLTQLLHAVLPQVGFEAALEPVLAQTVPLSDQGITRRLRNAGAILHGALAKEPRRSAIFEKLATHRSDMIRGVAAYVISADTELGLDRRLAQTRRFAADPSPAVRDCASDAIRLHLADDVPRALHLLERWVADKDANIRRCAVEATRPGGPSSSRLERLKQEPKLALPLLEQVRSDPSRYVQRAVANWLNDASRTRPEWVRAVCRRWQSESPTEQTRWIVDRALRTLRQQQKVARKRRASRPDG